MPLPPIDKELYLRGLNEEQHQAVVHDPAVPLQILAGPGSGKTRVVASRIAHLINAHGVAPKDIVSVTFTNKAAAEMRARLEVLVGPERVEKLVLGTFHAVCVRYLRPYHALIGLPAKFVIQDSDDGLKQIRALLTSDVRAQITKAGGEAIKRPEAWIQDEISKAKGRNQTPDNLRDKAAEEGVPDNSDLLFILADLYEKYQEGLDVAHALDFDDILSKALELFRKHGDRVLANIQHVFIDEFQDTNTIQYLLAKHLAGPRKAITIVGDPDQSIYGWRSANVENLQTMTAEFGGRQLFLEQNYRSTGNILTYGTAVIEKDEERIKKRLISIRGSWTVPVQREFADRETEVNYIAKEIKRVRGAFGLTWADFCILLRFNADSRMLETALAKEGIPNRVLNGRKFFQRMEVMIITGYLQLLENDNFAPAFERIINVPARRVGAVALKKISEVSRAKGISPVDVIRSSDIPFADGTLAFKACRKFVQVYDQLRQLAESRTAVTTIIETLLKKVAIEEHLERTEPDFVSRWENVLELKRYAASTERNLEDALAKEQKALARGEQPEHGNPLASMRPLQRFLQQTSLASDVTEETDDDDGSCVLMSTIHQAKGLEWPVVFVPSLVEGTLPAFMANTPEQVAEERRLFYVAVTRAEALLYVTHSRSKLGFGGKPEDAKASPFLPDLKTKSANGKAVATLRAPVANEKSRLALHAFLGRLRPAESEILATMKAKNLPEDPDDAWYGISLAQTSSLKKKFSWSGKSYWSSGDDVYALPPMPPTSHEQGGFAPASQLVKIKGPEARSTKPGPSPKGSKTAARIIQEKGPSSSQEAGPSSSSPPPLARPAPKSPPPPIKIQSSMRRGPAPVSYKRAPPPVRAPPKPDPTNKWVPPRVPDAERFTLPPMDAHTSRSADPSVLAREQPSLRSFSALANDSMAAWKSLGLPPDAGSSSAAAGPSSAPAPAVSSKTRGAGASKLQPVLNAQAAPWMPPSTTPSSTVPSAAPGPASAPERKRALGMKTRSKAPAAKKAKK